MPPVFQPISFIEKSEVSKNFEIPWFFSRNCFEKHSLKGKTQAVDCRPVAWNISDPCACALQCTIRPATPHRERLRSLGCGSSVGQTLPVNQFFSWAAGMRKKHCPSIFFGFGKKHVGNIFLKPPHPPQWKNLCKEELKFKSYIFRFFWTLKKATINQPQTSFWCWHVNCIGQILFIGIHSLLTCLTCKLCQSSSHCFGLDAHANTKAQ